MRQAKPSLRQLEYFIAVADNASFRRAAVQRGISQPTLTAQMAALENQLGVKLFERSRGGTRLSPTGRELLPLAREVIEELNGFVDAADLLREGPGGTYRLGTAPTLGPYLLPHVLPDLHQAYAKLRFHVREEVPRELERGLSDGRYDLLLTTLPLDSAEFSVAPLLSEPVRLAVSADHALSQRKALSASELRGEGILTVEEHHRFYRQVELLCQRLEARLLRDYQGTSLDALRNMVVMGMGHAFFPALYVLSEFHAQSPIRVLDVEGQAIHRVHALVWRSGSPSRVFFNRLARDMRQSISRRLRDVVKVVE